MLTRKQMEEIIAKGESVLYDGRVISTLADLPAADVLAKGDAAALQAQQDSIDEQIAALTRQRAKLAKGVEEAKAAPQAAVAVEPHQQAAPQAPPAPAKGKAAADDEEDFGDTPPAESGKQPHQGQQHGQQQHQQHGKGQEQGKPGAGGRK